MRRKIEISSSEAKIDRIGAKWRKKISKPPGKRDKWAILLGVRVENRATDPDFGQKTATRFRPEKQLCPALNSFFTITAEIFTRSLAKFYCQ